MNPSDKPEYDTALHACESAASKQKVPMVPIAQGGCMVARMEWKDEESGGAIYMKSLKLTLGEPAKAIESSARMYGASGIFSEPDYYALCSAAFHDYPRPLSNEQVEVEPQ